MSPENEELKRLKEAVRAVYYAAHWIPSRSTPIEAERAEALWTELRDAAGFEPGGSPPGEEA